MVVGEVLKKLEAMEPNTRRRNPCWKKLKELFEQTGNWQNAPRGKSREGNGGKPFVKKNAPDFDAAF